MKTTIHPDALKHFRKKAALSQEALAQRCGHSPSKPTIQRIENCKDGSYAISERLGSRLAKALDCAVGALSQPPEDAEKVKAEREALLKKHGYKPLRLVLDAETATAFRMVEHLYGIPVQSQIEMAPLFTVLLAEASLKWRRERAAEIRAAAEDLMALSGGHFSFANAAYRTLDGVAEELESIEQHDIFGAKINEVAVEHGYDPGEENPFSDFIKHFATQVGAKSVSFDDLLGWKTDQGMPDYRIGQDLIDEMAAGDTDAEYALVRGHVWFDDIPPELIGDDRGHDRAAWLAGHIPDEELELRRSIRNSLSLNLKNTDRETALQAPEPKDEADDA